MMKSQSSIQIGQLFIICELLGLSELSWERGGRRGGGRVIKDWGFCFGNKQHDYVTLIMTKAIWFGWII